MKVFNVEIADEVKDVLKAGKIDGSLYFLPNVQLDRKQYVDVNKILELLGGKWNKSKKAHVFGSDEKASELINALESGTVVDKMKTYQFFETPSDVARRMMEIADIKAGMSVLEPSAGHGAILEHLPKDVKLHIIEIDREKCEILEEKGYSPIDCVDFMTLRTDLGNFDRILMNPPFTNGQDADHILHAYEMLSDVGVLVSVASSSVAFNQQKKYQKLRQLIEEKGEIIKLDENSFKESGTSVNTVLVILCN